MNIAPFDTEQSRRDPNPSLQGIYENPDGTFETGIRDPGSPQMGTDTDSGEARQHQSRGQAEMDTPASSMNSGVDPFRRGDALEPAALHSDTLVSDTPEASESEQLAVNLIQPRAEPKG